MAPRVNGREGAASFLYSPCPSPTICYFLTTVTRGSSWWRRSAPRLAAVSPKQQGRRLHGAITPLGLEAGRPVALMAMAQPAGPRLEKRNA